MLCGSIETQGEFSVTVRAKKSGAVMDMHLKNYTQMRGRRGLAQEDQNAKRKGNKKRESSQLFVPTFQLLYFLFVFVFFV
ncbi:hypothetical protein CEXT_675551 [Caerostris extrusa]|uniref:Uncharacterized protein n=1 Tax=Caerostris extrusa TaxID=172846 RepID=A0AAV4SY34_CAEEX|nr:hypothetical protein CEXT_675551 [Caerostris extrusa]